MSSPITQTTGRRKEAVARVRLRPGTGTITINSRAFDNYFPIERLRKLGAVKMVEYTELRAKKR